MILPEHSHSTRLDSRHSVNFLFCFVAPTHSRLWWQFLLLANGLIAGQSPQVPQAIFVSVLHFHYFFCAFLHWCCVAIHNFPLAQSATFFSDAELCEFLKETFSPRPVNAKLNHFEIYAPGSVMMSESAQML